MQLIINGIAYFASADNIKDDCIKLIKKHVGGITKEHHDIVEDLIINPNNLDGSMDEAGNYFELQDG